MSAINSYKKILVAIDMSSEAQQVVQRAMEMANCFDAKLQLIHVIEPVGLNTPYELTPSLPVNMESVLVERAEEFLTRLANELGLSEIPRTVHVGSIKQIILDTAQKNEIDLIVTGTHGRHGLGLLLGSTATSVLHGTPCDVYAVKIKE